MRAISLGVVPAQKLAQSRPGARGALLFHAWIPVSEFSPAWPVDLPVQVHGMDADPLSAREGDIDAARALVGGTPKGELFIYPGDQHLFADRSRASFDPDASALLMKMALQFLSLVWGRRIANPAFCIPWSKCLRR